MIVIWKKSNVCMENNEHIYIDRIHQQQPPFRTFAVPSATSTHAFTLTAIIEANNYNWLQFLLTATIAASDLQPSLKQMIIKAEADD